MARGRSMGCPELLSALRRVQPRLAVCGHVHEGRGAEWIRWGAMGDSNREEHVRRWDDPGFGKKMSIVSMTPRAEIPLLDEVCFVPTKYSGSKETCVVNCSITATCYPHVGGRRLHKPIVVDLSLPVGEEG